MYPNFLILGPPKCASTSLHYYLGQHPDIHTSKIKETNFFSLHYEKGMAYYSNFFTDAKNKKAIGEATPSYAFLPFVAERIKNHLPDIKLILCFRNPVDRAFSSWLMHRGSGAEKCNFRETIEKNFQQMSRFTFGGEEGAQLWLKASVNNYDPQTRIRTDILGGMYAQILRNYLSHFKPGQIKTILLEDLKCSFDETMSSLFSFLGVDPSFIPKNKTEKNNYIDRKANRIANTIFGINGTRFLLKNIPVPVKNILKKRVKTKSPPKLNMEDRLYLWNIYKHDVAQLEIMLGRNLSHWNPENNKLTY